MASLIQSLIDEGVLVLYHDYRAGHMQDLSGNGNHGVPTNVTWGGGGVQFPLTTSVITVADAPGLQLTAGTLIAFGEFMQQTNGERVITKRDAGGTNYEFNLNGAPAQLNLYDGTATRTRAANVIGSNYIAVNMENGQIPEGFVDGLSVGAFNLAAVLSVYNAPLLIGHRFSNTLNVQSPLYAVLIVNRQLTATEHALLYAELESLTWPSKAKAFAKGAYGPELMNDGAMEAAGVAAYTAGNAATLTKEDGRALSGSQVLRVAHGGTNNPFAKQTILTAATRYRVTGWARGDGTFYPWVRANTVFWAGTNAITWQYFDITFDTGLTVFDIGSWANAAGWVEFDNISVTEVLEDKTQWKSDWNTKVVANLGGNDQIPNTPFWVNSGNFGVVIDTVDGEECKVIDCAASGGFQMLTTEMQGSPHLDAYGSWEFWFSKAAGSFFVCHFISDDLAGTNGYSLQIFPTEEVTLLENGVMLLFTSAAAYINADTWYKIRITRRQVDGMFTVYLNDVLVDVTGGTGANPVADNTVTESTYLVFDVDTGDRICLSSKSGNYSLSKQHGVIAP